MTQGPKLHFLWPPMAKGMVSLPEIQVSLSLTFSIQGCEPEPKLKKGRSQSQIRRKVGAGARARNRKFQFELEEAIMLQARTKKYIFQLKTCFEIYPYNKRVEPEQLKYQRAGTVFKNPRSRSLFFNVLNPSRSSLIFVT